MEGTRGGGVHHLAGGGRMIGNDIARCAGVGDDADGWREGCQHCQRRTTPGGPYTPHMEPPPIVALWCEYEIEPGGHETLRPGEA